MSTQENKRIVRVMLDDLFCETAYAFYSTQSSFEGHMIDYSISPLHGKEAAEAYKSGQALTQTLNMREAQRRGERAMTAIYPDGNCRAIKSMTAEGNRVIAEYFVHGGRTIFHDEREHNFHCVKVFELEDEQVVNIREYIDSGYMVDIAKPIAAFFGERLKQGADASGADLDAAERSSWGSSWLLKSQWIELGHARISVDAEELQRNKEIALTAVENWGDEAMLDAMADHVLFNNQIDLETFPVLAKMLRSKDELAELCARTKKAFPDGLSRTIRAVTAEENRVCVEDTITGKCVVRPDLEFTTRTLKICFLNGGKIFRIRQYVDSGYLRFFSPELIGYLFGMREDLPEPASG